MIAAFAFRMQHHALCQSGLLKNTCTESGANRAFIMHFCNARDDVVLLIYS